MKSGPTLTNIAAATLREYILALQESGLDGIPSEVPGTPSPVSSTQVDVISQAASITPLVPVHVPAPAQEKEENLDQIRRDLGDCQRCKLGATRTNLVFGVGNPKARLVFVGEGPGADEDAQGEPFVGEAGQILNRIIIAMGLKREEVYICNVVKCRPPKNRDPEQDEIAACAGFMLRQIQAIKPEAIVGLGKFASQTLLETKEPISRLRGKFRDFHGVPLMPTYHPSFLLRRQKEGSMEAFWEVWDDMTQVLRLLKLPVPEKTRKR